MVHTRCINKNLVTHFEQSVKCYGGGEGWGRGGEAADWAILKILSVCCAPTDPPKSPRPNFFFRYFRFVIFFFGVSVHSDSMPKTDIKGVL